MGAHIKKIRVLKALVLVVLVMVVSPKWRLCVFANAEEEVGLAKRIDPDIQGVAFNTPDDIDAFLK